MALAFADFRIPLERLDFKASRSSGPGGQSVNKSETKVELRFQLATADWLASEVRERLKNVYATRLTLAGDFVIACDVHRSQLANQRECVERLREMIGHVWARPKSRRATRPTRGSRERRLGAKKIRSSRKKERGGNYDGS